MKLKNYTSQDLRDELQRRHTKEMDDKWSTKPTDQMPYSKEGVLQLYQGRPFIYLAEIEDGAEGSEILIQSDEEFSDDELIKVAQHYVLQSAEDGEYDEQIDSIGITQIGRYSLTFLKLN